MVAEVVDVEVNEGGGVGYFIYAANAAAPVVRAVLSVNPVVIVVEHFLGFVA